MSLRRFYGLCGALVFLAGVVLCRTYWVGQQAAYAASAGGQTVQTLDLPRTRGDFYDRNGRKLTGTQMQYYALCIPGDDGYTALFPYVSYEKQGVLYDRRNLAAPFLIEVSRDLTGRGIATCAVPAHTVDIAPHLLGYLDGEDRGVAGLERAYDALLTACGDKRTVSCVLAAHSGLMAGTSPVWATREEGTGQGVQLTLDADLQRACEALAAQLMPRGCILIMDAATGEVLASVSAPTFDAQDVAASIRADDTSLINRPFAAFSAGSVFKVVLAAAAYEQGLDWFTHDCTGEIVVAGQTYRCAQGRAHGEAVPVLVDHGIAAQRADEERIVARVLGVGAHGRRQIGVAIGRVARAGLFRVEPGPAEDAAPDAQGIVGNAHMRGVFGPDGGVAVVAGHQRPAPQKRTQPRFAAALTVRAAEVAQPGFAGRAAVDRTDFFVVFGSKAHARLLIVKAVRRNGGAWRTAPGVRLYADRRHAGPP